MKKTKSNKSSSSKKNRSYNEQLLDYGDVSNLSKCAADYALSLADPFNGPEDACIPDYPALMTQRVRTFAKGAFATSNNAAAAGFGWIAFDPQRFCCSNASGLSFNVPASTQTAINFVPGQFTSVSSNSPFVLANFVPVPPATLQYRIVSAGLRIRYIGSELTRGGQIVGLHHPAHRTVWDFDIPSMDAFKESARLPVTREWTTLVWRPVDTDDLDFANTFSAVTPAESDTAYPMGFCIQAPDTTGAVPQSFEYEAYANFEFQGDILTNKKPSHVDPVGHGAVNAITSMALAIHGPTQTPSSHLGKAMLAAAHHYVGTHTSQANKGEEEEHSHASSTPWWQSLLGIAGPIIGALL